ncbi:ferredoxin [Desulfobacca acetoxidans]|uniref:Ferredoxin n=1 Tax=Desulfobacca acetoxidans (strain ATCC 700848 / DSM 11109 / ASRB2) TaxID=880072 RepID=F2NEM3_DESAR|nr:ferredoxin [Desulfobacca acetoxidans]AEB08213.1 4Fe-4S ferredoxin iron-sulfur binding domain-containing protein [Desulfobacca acetoxidans DSM 11109]HAY20782.1 ferredoxin [Desulfobacterales bacterium]
MARRVAIDEDACIFCGTCADICPEVFALNVAKQKSEVLKPEDGPVDLIQEAIDSCPAQAIHWEE